MAAGDVTGLLNCSESGGTQPDATAAKTAQSAISDIERVPAVNKTMSNQSSFFRVIKTLRTKPYSRLRNDVAPYYDQKRVKSRRLTRTQAWRTRNRGPAPTRSGIPRLSPTISRASSRKPAKPRPPILKPREEGKEALDLSDGAGDFFKTHRQGRRILADRAGARAGGGAEAVDRVFRPVVELAEAHDGRACRAGGGAGAARPAFHRPGLERKPVLRFPEAALSHHQPLGDRHGRAGRGGR